MVLRLRLGSGWVRDGVRVGARVGVRVGVRLRVGGSSSHILQVPLWSLMNL